jgi:hypothetical protein
LLEEEYWQTTFWLDVDAYVATLCNNRNTSIVMSQYRKSSIVYTPYWMYQYRAFTILEYQNRWYIHNTGFCCT